MDLSFEKNKKCGCIQKLFKHLSTSFIGASEDRILQEDYWPTLFNDYIIGNDDCAQNKCIAHSDSIGTFTEENKAIIFSLS